MSQTILMPALTAGMEEGTISRWLKKEGDAFATGEAIAEVETDKATMEIEAEQDGVLDKILAVEGSLVQVNAAIATLTSGNAVPGDEANNAEITLASTSLPVNSATLLEAPAAISPSPSIRKGSSPLARRMATERGISIEGITGSGPGGRVVRLDVEMATIPSALSNFEAPPKIETPFFPQSDCPHHPIPNTPMRKVIAKRLSEAKNTIPHFYLNMECEIDSLLELRETLNVQGGGRYKISVNDLIVKAAAIALRKVPEINVAWTDEAVLFFEDIDISIAVSTDNGLITPIVRHADQKGLTTISSEVRELADRARNGKLQPREYQGGTFTISNLGMFGLDSFSAIINPPQSCILAIGAGMRRAVVRGDSCVPATVMSCTLSVDHRSVDGAAGARYLAVFKSLIEQPLQLML